MLTRSHPHALLAAPAATHSSARSCVTPSSLAEQGGVQPDRLNPVEEFGSQLEAAGFAKYGQETMVSGVTGEEMAVDIYIGLVYYQRLRHMVSDKFQVRGRGAMAQRRMGHGPRLWRRAG